MRTVRAEGRAKFQGFGDHGTTIVLLFANAVDAEAAERVLGSAWRLVGGDHLDDDGTRALITRAVGSTVDEREAQLQGMGLAMLPCGWKHCGNKGGKNKPCRARGICEMTHSIDYGPSFEVHIPVHDVPAEQSSLF